MSNSYTCIYCKHTKLKKEFNREHVIPQAFGKFVDNITLTNKVCEECNQKYGNTIDESLARAAVEGIHRFKHGLKASKDFQYEKHAKNQTHIDITEPFDGEEIKLIPSSNGIGCKRR